jgi:gliding motility-associated-like protein
MTPTAATANVYGVMLADNPTLAGYDVTKFDDTLCSVNPHFFHNMYHTQGTDAAAITMYFDPTADGAWTDMAHWRANNIWNYMGLSTSGSGYGLSSIEVGNWSDFNTSPFALAAKKFTVDAGQDQDIYAGQTASLNATISTISFDSIQWTPDMYLSSAIIADPTAKPVETTEYVVTVSNNIGCKVKDSVKITVLPTLLLVPTAFSPNLDGTNDYFRPLNKNLNRLVFEVFDRWGQKIYESDMVGDMGWDGTFKGHKQDIGVYVWQAQYQLEGDTKTLSASGNVTLLR